MKKKEANYQITPEGVSAILKVLETDKEMEERLTRSEGKAFAVFLKKLKK